MKTHVLLTGITSVGNRGVEALVATTAAEVRRRRPGTTIAVLGRSGVQDVERLAAHGVGYVPVGSRQSTEDRAALSPSRSRLFSALLRRPAKPGPTTMRGVVGGAGIVVASGGDSFSVHYGSIPSHLQPLRMALSAGVPVAFLAQSVGPFATAADGAAFAEVARRAALVTVRDPDSHAFLVDGLGLESEQVHETADPAFLLEPPGPDVLARDRRAAGIDGDGPVVALAPSQAICRLAAQDDTAHARAWGSVIRACLDELGARVLLVPHVRGTRPESDDSLLAERLLADLAGDPRVRIAPPLDASGLKGIIGACDFVIAERMHAAIAGLSSGVPTAVVSYSRKAGGIMRQVLGPELAGALVVPIEDFLDPDCARVVLRDGWARRGDVRVTLEHGLPAVRAMAARNFDLLAPLIP